MSKYIIDIPDGVEWGVLTCRTEDGFYTRDFDSLDELNSDYINEHFGELQDEAYKRGYEDGKKSQNDDRIEVGDWVYDESDTPNSWAVVTWADGDDTCVMCKDGSTAEKKTHELRKTGRHFDIASILEAMRQ